ncbi:MAG: hypothetical protein RSC58_04960, partial [Ruthenibacterium sp.]
GSKKRETLPKAALFLVQIEFEGLPHYSGQVYFYAICVTFILPKIFAGLFQKVVIPLRKPS